MSKWPIPHFHAGIIIRLFWFGAISQKYSQSGDFLGQFEVPEKLSKGTATLNLRRDKTMSPTGSKEDSEKWVMRWGVTKVLSFKRFHEGKEEMSDKWAERKQGRTNNDAAFQCNFPFNIFNILWMISVSIELYNWLPIDFTWFCNRFCYFYNVVTDVWMDGWTDWWTE